MSPVAQRGLGKGLSALMSDSYSQTVNKDGEKAPVKVTNTLPHGKIKSGKFQPRSQFDKVPLEELAESIRKNGIMQPIIVRPTSKDEYEIIAGERRWRAAKLANMKDVPVIIRDVTDQVALELALVENVQRQDLNPLEEGAGYQRLMDEFRYTQEELSTTVGKSRSHIANLLRLLDLPEEIKEFVQNGKLSAGHARALIGVKNSSELAREIVRRGLNVRQTEKLIKEGNPEAYTRKNNKPRTNASLPPIKEKDSDILALEETLSENLGLKVSINDRGQSGEIIVAYQSLEQLDEILRRLGGSI